MEIDFMNFMIDNKYPLGYLPNGLTDKNLSEICQVLSGVALSLNFVDISNAYRGQTATDMLEKCNNPLLKML